MENSAEVLKNWDEIKKKEKSQKSVADTLKGVSASLPALVRASKIKAKACKVGFEYPSVDGAVEKVAEEFDEVKAEIAKGRAEGLADLSGKILQIAHRGVFAENHPAVLFGVDL